MMSRRIQQSLPSNISSPDHSARGRYARPVGHYGGYINPYDYPYFNFHTDPRLSPMFRVNSNDPLGYDPHRTFLDPLRLRPSFVENDNASWDRRAPREGSKRPTDSQTMQQAPGRGMLQANALAKINEKAQRGAMPLGKSLRMLNRRIEVSEEIYIDFMRGYDDDIERIKKYCPKSVLNTMWAFRVKGEKHQNEGEDNGVEDVAETFELHSSQTIQALRDVLSSSMKDFKGSRLASAERLKEKIRTYKGQISKLLELAPKARTHCEALLAEFKELKEIINPESDKNRDIFAMGVGDEDDERAGEEEAYSE